MTDHGLPLALRKTEIVVLKYIQTYYHIQPINPMRVGYIEIEIMSTVKYLGIPFDSKSVSVSRFDALLTKILVKPLTT